MILACHSNADKHAMLTARAFRSTMEKDFGMKLLIFGRYMSADGRPVFGQ